MKWKFTAASSSRNFDFYMCSAFIFVVRFGEKKCTSETHHMAKGIANNGGNIGIKTWKKHCTISWSEKNALIRNCPRIIAKRSVQLRNTCSLQKKSLRHFFLLSNVKKIYFQHKLIIERVIVYKRSCKATLLIAVKTSR